jgi:hypothetical protein
VVGSVSGAGQVTVNAMTFKNGSTGAVRTGLLIEVREVGGGLANFDIANAYVDYDEIDALLKGLDTLSTIDPRAVSQLKNYEAIYSTKGDLQVVVFNETSGKKSVAIKAGTFVRRAFVDMASLEKLRGLIVRTKAILDDPAAAAREDDPRSTPSDSERAASASRQPRAAPVPALQRGPQTPAPARRVERPDDAAR